MVKLGSERSRTDTGEVEAEPEILDFFLQEQVTGVGRIQVN